MLLYSSLLEYGKLIGLLYLSLKESYYNLQVQLATIVTVHLDKVNFKKEILTSEPEEIMHINTYCLLLIHTVKTILGLHK